MAEGDLSFFVMLARRESFSATAQDLGLSASAVSRRSPGSRIGWGSGC